MEAICFPPAEAAPRTALAARLAVFPSHFWLAEEESRIIGMINGAVICSRTLADEFYTNAALHEESGPYQSVFGLDVLPAWRCRGVGAALMQALVTQARREGRRGVVLTCKERLVLYYEKLGYHSLGISASIHGGAVWYDMLLEF